MYCLCYYPLQSHLNYVISTHEVINQLYFLCIEHILVISWYNSTDNVMDFSPKHQVYQSVPQFFTLRGKENFFQI